MDEKPEPKSSSDMETPSAFSAFTMRCARSAYKKAFGDFQSDHFRIRAGFRNNAGNMFGKCGIAELRGGTLTEALRPGQLFNSVSAFRKICRPRSSIKPERSAMGMKTSGETNSPVRLFTQRAKASTPSQWLVFASTNG